MPMYEYRCECGRRFEQLRALGDRDNAVCPSCASTRVERVAAAAHFQFRPGCGGNQDGKLH